MKSISLTGLYTAISRVSSEAVLNQLQLKKPSLRRYLKHQFTEGFGAGGGFLADPLIESTFSWETAGDQYTMASLAEAGLLSQTLVDVMDQAPANPKKRDEDAKRGVVRCEYDPGLPEDEDTRWPASRPPYKHQLEAWKVLGDASPRSVIVTAGTGSGKSECFMVPMLNDMAKQVDHDGDQLVGVQAIMLYPLNALINSQRDRLIGWTRGFSGNIRFALYNGETPNKRPATRTSTQASWYGEQKPEEVRDRESIRQAPPPVLVTNATMLEYMLVRPEDSPILKKSQGKLRWIILDEAHTLVGSTAAETSLLLRRTMHAFGVKPQDVRFVATSATIGDQKNTEETDKKLKDFLSSLAGVSTDQITVVRGYRNVPQLPEKSNVDHNLSVWDLENREPGEAYDTLSGMPAMRDLRKALVANPMTLRDIAALINGVEADAELPTSKLIDALRIVDVATNAYPNGDKGKDAFLPIRAHLFHRAQSGLWACVNPECQGKAGTALESDWPFGQVFLSERQNCISCSYPVYELTHCSNCHEPSLNGVRYLSENNTVTFKARELSEVDEYSDELEFVSEDASEQLDTEQRDELVQIYTASSEIHDRHSGVGGATEAYLISTSGEISHSKVEGVPIFYSIGANGTELRCACCNSVERREGSLFKRAILGSPFLMGNIVPEMLQHIPSDAKSRMAGRRLITFTDSRQGTARFSARLQLDAERRWTRSMVYRHLAELADAHQTTSDVKHPKLEDLLKQREQYADNPVLLYAIDQAISELNSNQVPKQRFVSSTEMIDRLAATDEVRLLSGIGNFSEDLLPGEYSQREEGLGSSKALARLFLLREFARRPLNSNNLESLGLVKVVYPDLEKLTEEETRRKNKVWFDLGFDFAQWKSFLKIFLDIYIRDESIIDLRPSEKNWMGARLYARLLQPQRFVFDSDPDVRRQQTSAYKVLPVANESRPHRLARLLELSSGLPIANYGGKFDQVLEGAFDTLKQLNILQWVEFEEREIRDGTSLKIFKREGYQLKFSAFGFDLIDTAYLCPLTHRWIDTPMHGPGLKNTLGITSLATGDLALDDVLIRQNPVKVPRPNKSLLGLDHDSSNSLANWLAEAEEVEELRDMGLWRDLNDAAIKPPALLRSREHSAQQSAEKLKQFEKAFKNDALQVLNCSTTMEMGVDIGSLSMVAMNNAPPSTANYLQRAGRAGRRGQSTSIVLTFCKSTPHGQRIFSDPRWPFSSTPVPKVALDSAVIVRRHVNAYMLAQYLLLQGSSESLPVMKSGNFFVSEYQNTKHELFMAWLENDALGHDRVLQGLSTLIQGTALAGLSPASIVQACRSHMGEVATHWLGRYAALKQLLDDADKTTLDDDMNSKQDFAFKRLEQQLAGMKREYLLGMLAGRGFLPGYGFPTNVVELVTNNVVESRSNIHERPDYPARSLDVAIREYEPGKDVVLNGAVYRSAGLQLSWKIPETEAEVRKHQVLRYVAYCDCGYHSSDHDTLDSLPTLCPECERPVSRMEYLVPSGFQVDFRAPLHNDYTKPEYAEYQQPLVTIDEAEWQALGRVDYGRFRATQFGNVFHYNDGNGAGYAFCWHCGRAHTIQAARDQDGLLVVSDSERARITAKHRRLSGTRQNNNVYCPNEPWTIKVGKINDDTQTIDMPVVLGFPTTTTMLELQIRDPETHSWVCDRTFATSFAAALRMAFCEMEGVSEAEIGASVQQRMSPDKTPASSIFIFDKASQGAGYATQISERLPEVIRAAFKHVSDCSNRCDKACHGCLLDFETQHQVEHLDRHAVIKFLEQRRFIERLSVAVERRYFGDSSTSELLNARSLVTLKASRATEIDIFVSGKDWELADHPVLKQIKFLSGQKVRLLIEKTVADEIEPELAWQLQKAIDASVEIVSYTHPPHLGPMARPVLRLVIQGQEHWYVTDDLDTVSLNEKWGSTENVSLVGSRRAELSITTSKLDLSRIAQRSGVSSSVAVIEDVGSLCGDVGQFGERFISLITGEAPTLHSAFSRGIERVIYQDRYITSPVAVMLITDIMSALKVRYGNFSGEIKTCHPPARWRYQSCPADDFTSEADFSAFIDGAMSVSALECSTEFIDKRDLPHGRSLVIQVTGGTKYRVLFDQGMGYWANRSNYLRTRFNFKDLYGEGSRYKETGLLVKGSTGETYILVHQIDGKKL